MPVDMNSGNEAPFGNLHDFTDCPYCGYRLVAQGMANLQQYLNRQPDAFWQFWCDQCDRTIYVERDGKLPPPD